MKALLQRIEDWQEKQNARIKSMSKKAKFFTSLGLVVVPLISVLAIDYFIYRHKVLEIDLVSLHRHLDISIEKLEREYGQYQRCAALHNEFLTTSSEEARDSFRGCLLEETPLLQTPEMVVAFSHLLEDWLHKNENDSDVEAVGLRAIDKSREGLFEKRETEIKPLLELKKVVETSFVGKVIYIINGVPIHEDYFQDFLEALNKAELRLQLPQVAAEQDEKVFQSYLKYRDSSNAGVQ